MRMKGASPISVFTEEMNCFSVLCFKATGIKPFASLMPEFCVH